MLQPAELGTCAQEGASRIRTNPEQIRLVRDGIHLSPQLWHPEIVDDICCLQAYQDRFADWNMDLVRSHNAGLRVPDFPPPLLTDDDQVRRLPSMDRRISSARHRNRQA